MKVRVYGFPHSPWVQAVLFALCEKNIEYKLDISPPLSVFKKWGVYMPAVSFDEGPWEIESTDIIAKLGFEAISNEALKAANKSWQGVLHRTDNPLKFFSAFSNGGQTSKSFLSNAKSNLILSFVAFYMFLLISIGKFRLNQKEPENFGDQFIYWENILKSSQGPFIEGEKPGVRDFVIFGIVQCHSSIPVPALEAILNDKRLHSFRSWIYEMQKRYKDLTYLYSTKYFEYEETKIISTGLKQKIFFFFGLILLFLLFPLSAAGVLLLMAKVEKNRIKKF
tara:strand:+ start:166 stop:1005 length:840 start_codon:yes stop_codon:yes gene_type:complete